MICMDECKMAKAEVGIMIYAQCLADCMEVDLDDKRQCISNCGSNKECVPTCFLDLSNTNKYTNTGKQYTKVQTSTKKLWQ